MFTRVFCVRRFTDIEYLDNFTEINWNLVEEIYVAKRRVLEKLAFRRVKDFYLAEDIIQNTMEVACKNAIKE